MTNPEKWESTADIRSIALPLRIDGWVRGVADQHLGGSHEGLDHR